MSQRVNTFNLGLVMIVVVALFIATLLFIAGVPHWAKTTRSIQVRFPHTAGVPGLKASSAVVLAGLNVGQDLSLQLSPGVKCSKKLLHEASTSRE